MLLRHLYILRNMISKLGVISPFEGMIHSTFTVKVMLQYVRITLFLCSCSSYLIYQMISKGITVSTITLCVQVNLLETFTEETTVCCASSKKEELV